MMGAARRAWAGRGLVDAVAVGGVYALLAARFWFVSDDAYISFRYARNWARGLGLRYNPGESPPVEGYSNFLWVALAALVERAGLDPVVWMPVLSFLAGGVLLALVYRAVLVRLGLGRAAALLATLGLAAFPPFAVWASGGLETMAFSLALFAAADALLLRERPAPRAAALAGLATALLRIEGIAWAVLVGILGAIAHPAGRRAVRPYFAVLLAGYGAYTLGRWLYFDALVPLPVRVKVAFGPDVLLRGFRYVASFEAEFLTPLVLLVAGAVVALRRGPRPKAVAVASLAAAVPAYAALVGGDWMAMGRFLVPGLAFLALLAGWLAAALESRRPAAPGLAAAAGIAVALLPGFNRHLVPRSIRAELRFMYSHPGFRSEYERWRRQAEEPRVWAEIGRVLRRITKPGDSIVVGAIGALGYESGLVVYDRFGLVSPEVARAPWEDGPLRSPGHDRKVSRDFFLPRSPTILLFDVVAGENLRERVLEQAAAWRGLGLGLWRRYVPDFVEMDGRPLAEARRLLLVYRAIEEPAELAEASLPRPERRRRRAAVAERAWARFYERCEALPSARPAPE